MNEAGSNQNEINESLSEDGFQEEWLSAYLDDELSQAERLVVEERLKTDAKLRVLLDDLTQVKTFVHALPKWDTAIPAVDVCNGDVSNIVDRGDSSTNVPLRRSGSSGNFSWWRPLSVAASLGAIAVLGYSLWKPQGQSWDLAKNSLTDKASDVSPSAGVQQSRGMLESAGSEEGLRSTSNDATDVAPQMASDVEKAESREGFSARSMNLQTESAQGEERFGGGGLSGFDGGFNGGASNRSASRSMFGPGDANVDKAEIVEGERASKRGVENLSDGSLADVSNNAATGVANDAARGGQRPNTLRNPMEMKKAENAQPESAKSDLQKPDFEGGEPELFSMGSPSMGSPESRRIAPDSATPMIARSSVVEGVPAGGSDDFESEFALMIGKVDYLIGSVSVQPPDALTLLATVKTQLADKKIRTREIAGNDLKLAWSPSVDLELDSSNAGSSKTLGVLVGELAEGMQLSDILKQIESLDRFATVDAFAELDEDSPQVAAIVLQPSELELLQRNVRELVLRKLSLVQLSNAKLPVSESVKSQLPAEPSAAAGIKRSTDVSEIADAVGRMQGEHQILLIIVPAK